MNQHKGKMIKRAIKERGISISNVSKKMKISRGTLYNRFEEANIKDEFIYELGKVIKYDFDLDRTFDPDEPGLSDIAGIYASKNKKLEELKTKYIDFVKSYNRLLLLLIRLANKNVEPTLQKEIERTLATEVESLEGSVAKFKNSELLKEKSS